MFHISLLAVPALYKSSLSESACIRKEWEIVGMEQLETADAPPASSCPSLHSAGGSFSPPHLRLSFLLALPLPMPSSKAVFLSLIYNTNIVSSDVTLLTLHMSCHLSFHVYVAIHTSEQLSL